MRGSPRSVMLSWANAMAGWWTSATVSAVQRQQRAIARSMLTAMTAKPAKAKRRRAKRKPR
jgi:hypothetical protein